MEAGILSYLPYLDGIVALDASTDKTPDILREYGATVIPEGSLRWHAGNVRNFLIGQCKTPWAWFFFPDERVETIMTPDQVRKMIKSHTNKHGVLRLKRWNLMGFEEKDGWKYPDWQGNIVRDHVRYTMRIHEVPTYSGSSWVSVYNLQEEPIRTIHLLRPCDQVHRDANKWERFCQENP